MGFIKVNVKDNQISVLFRFLSLNRMQSFTLNKELMDAYCIEVEEKKQYIGMVPLTDINFNDIIDFYIKQQLKLDDCDITIKVNVSETQGHHSVPTIVSQMLKHIECSLSVTLSHN